MQPLALQKASILADAGDAATASTTSQSSSGAVFNDVLASVTSKAQNAAGDTGRQAAGGVGAQQPGEADQDVAALTAATQLASRGVGMKTAPLAAELNLTATTAAVIAVEATDDSQVADIAGEQSAVDGEGETVATAEAEVTKTVDPTDAAGLNVQELIQLAVTASITVADPQVDTKAIVEADVKADGKVEVDAEAAPLPIDALDGSNLTDADKGIVDFLTPRANPDMETAAQAIGEHMASPEQTNQPPKIAALQAVAWFKTGAASTAGEEAEASDGQAEIDAATQTDLLKAEASSEADDGADAQYAPPAPSVDADSAALAMVYAAPVNAAAPAQNPQQPAPDDLMLHQPSLRTQWQDPAAPKAFNPTSDYSATQDEASGGRIIERTIAAQGHDAAVAVEIMNADRSNGDGLATLKAASGVKASTEPSSEIRGLATVTLTDTLQYASAETSPAEVVTSEGFVKQPGSQGHGKNKADLSSTEAETEADAEVKGDARPEAHVSGGVHIRELLKFGVTDVTLIHEAPPLPPQVQAEATQSFAAQEISNNLTAPPQAATAASSNVETNGERRTIAEDIRLRALERMVVNAVRNGTQILSIQLYPPGLGQVMLRLAMDGTRLRLTSRASTAEAVETLRNMETDLRSALAGNGVHLAGFDVSEDGPNDDAPRRQPAEPVVKTRNGGTDESFTVELNA